jgi:hypothetical protein
LQINAKQKSNPFMCGESVKVYVMKAGGVFFSLPKEKQLSKITILFGNTVVHHLHGLVGNIKFQLHKNAKIL